MFAQNNTYSWSSGMKRFTTIVGLTVSLALPFTLAAQMANSPSAQAQSGVSSSLVQDQAAAYPPSPQTVANPPSAHTYDHGEVGAFADYLRFNPSGAAINFVGAGGRVAFNVHPNIALEAEMNYDFAQNYTTTTTTGTSSTTTSTFTTTSLRPLTGLFGPKFQIGTSSAVRAFVTGKLGFINFSTSNPNNVSGSSVSSSISSVGGAGTHLAFYPGGGLEAFLGPIGLRAEAGDEIYLDNGTYNNLRVTVGPTLRF
jgi:hypothetical protein